MWACERGKFVNAGAQNGEKFGSGVCCAFSFLLLSLRVSRKSLDLIAIRKGFKEILPSCTQGF